MAPPRARTTKNKGLPENLYPNGKYFIYRNPITGKRTSINKSLTEAIRLAKSANAKLAPLMVEDGALLTTLTGEKAPTLSSLLERFEDEWLPTRGYAQSSLDEIGFKIARYKKELGHRMVGQLDVLAIAEYLDKFENNAYTNTGDSWSMYLRLLLQKAWPSET
ncbi:phage integrase Arm DNA-binding domain-containing protein [Pseudomonas citrulli]|uniref:Phage integrase Arm DNA-binding domain-containing protein n=1 Tax=Pseudomonas citrulli TaxID=3064347 RepID=A0ABT9BX12_9PSED|nr:phage integrase Arm DNA-binding domain-containing protein [Pseudomonas sp. K18]MDO7897090.1 phage integrase Arm DNA-binding domain-containing protein [Pseudomonas sp. K18]